MTELRLPRTRIVFDRFQQPIRSISLIKSDLELPRVRCPLFFRHSFSDSLSKDREKNTLFTEYSDSFSDVSEKVRSSATILCVPERSLADFEGH
jgi:hypothetical protein